MHVTEAVAQWMLLVKVKVKERKRKRKRKREGREAASAMSHKYYKQGKRQNAPFWSRRAELTDLCTDCLQTCGSKWDSNDYAPLSTNHSSTTHSLKLSWFPYYHSGFHNTIPPLTLTTLIIYRNHFLFPSLSHSVTLFSFLSHIYIESLLLPKISKILSQTQK